MKRVVVWRDKPEDAVRTFKDRDTGEIKLIEPGSLDDDVADADAEELRELLDNQGVFLPRSVTVETARTILGWDL